MRSFCTDPFLSFCYEHAEYSAQQIPALSRPADTIRNATYQGILVVNPTAAPEREEAQQVSVSVFDYNAEILEEKKFDTVTDLLTHRQNSHISWINIDGLRKADVEAVCNHFGIHQLLMEDILSINQRPKVDEVDGILFSLLNMLYYNNEKQTVEQDRSALH